MLNAADGAPVTKPKAANPAVRVVVHQDLPSARSHARGRGKTTRVRPHLTAGQARPFRWLIA